VVSLPSQTRSCRVSDATLTLFTRVIVSFYEMPFPMKNYFSVALLLTATTLTGCAGSSHAAATPTPRASETPTSLEAVTEVIRLQSLHPHLYLSGSVTPTEEGAVSITTPLDGVVIRPMVRVGDFVHKDQPLAELNSVFGQTGLQVMNQLETYQTALSESEKNLSTAETGLATARTTLGQAYAAVSAAKSQVGQADAELTAAHKDLRRKIELEQAGVYAKVDVDEARDRAGKAQAVYHDAQNQVLIAQRLIPYDQASVGEFQKAISLARNETAVARAAYSRNQAVLLQSSIVGTALPPGLARNLQLDRAGNTGSAGAASRFVLRAPISGIVSDLSMTPGLKITNGTAVGNVTDISRVYVDANAFESDVASVKAGDKIECTSLAYPNRGFPGHVSYISRRVQSDTRAIVVRSEIDNQAQLLRPSMFVKVQVEMPAVNNAIILPDSAVLSIGDDSFAVVKTGPKTFEKRKLTLGARSGGKTQVTYGLKPGETVVIQGNLLLNLE
jgi:RND family efflux transporter MFP subunit